MPIIKKIFSVLLINVMIKSNKYQLDIGHFYNKMVFNFIE